jgi:trimethylamine:corrinoid methyltransferase-like protein
VFEKRLPHYEVLSDDAMEVIERGWRRLISEIGVEFLHDDAVELFRQAGQRIEGQTVHFDPDFVLEQVAKAPSEYDLVARNPARTVRVGGRHMFFAPTQGPPFVREGADRREATMADFERFCRLSQVFEQLDTPGGLCCEPNDRPLDSRHLDMVLAVQTLTDKPYMGAVITGGAAHDTLEMTDLLFGPNEAKTPEARVFAVVNANSPLRFDTRMLEAMIVYAEAGQVNVITPFLLMGAMSPASVPASLVQQTVEGLAGANYVEHAAGWLESGLVACYEKFIVDIEMLRMLKEEFTPLEVDEASLAFGAHEEVGPGGHFLGAMHTLERFRDCFYRPLLSSTENYERWERNGGLDAAARATAIWHGALDGYEQPPMDAGVRAALEEFVTRRRTELGD